MSRRFWRQEIFSAGDAMMYAIEEKMGVSEGMARVFSTGRFFLTKGVESRCGGITRLQRYYGPLRHPIAPGLSLAGFQLLVFRSTTRQDFPCCVYFPLSCMPSPISRRTHRLRFAPFTCDSGLPHYVAGSASALHFSRPAQRSLVLRPACSPNPIRTLYTGGFSRFVASTTAPIATGWSESCRAGFAPAEKQHLCTAHGIAVL